MEVVSYYLSYILILVPIMYLSSLYLWNKLHNRPPTPFLCYPVFGHIYLLNRHPFTETFTNLANKYGPILFLWIGWRPTIIVSSPALAEECLAKNDIAFCNRPSNTIAAKYRGYNYGSINFAPYGPHWRNLRKISAVEILSPHRIQLLAALRADEVRLLIKRLCSSQVADMRKHVFDTTMNIMTRMIFGKRYYGVEARSEEARRIREMVEESLQILNEPFVGDDVPYLRWMDWNVKKKLGKYRDKREKLLTELIEDHRVSRREMMNHNKCNVEPNVKPMIQVLLDLQESDPDYYTEMVIQSLVVDLLQGGSETSTNTVEWALSLLLNHPEVLTKVRTEIDNHVGHGRLLNDSDLNHLPYLRCILNETLRMYPPFPNLIPHESSEDCIVGGYRIQRGTFLLINLHGIQNDPKIWDSPASFRPERFQEAAHYKIGHKMMPFGSGRRSCPGEGLAIRVIELILGTLIQCLDLQRIDNQIVDSTALHVVNLVKNEALSVRIEPRQEMIKLLQQL